MLGAAAAAGGAAAGAAPAQAPSAPARAAEPEQAEVRLEHLRPRQIDARISACPTLFQPLGTIEWHGYHSVVGVDALKAHGLCVRAAQRGGGLVAPALYGGVGGVKEPHTFIMDPERDSASLLLRPWVETLCREAVRHGFRALIILTGHYGAEQQIVLRDLAVRMTRSLGIPVLGTPEYFLALDAAYTGDHAAWGETSLMMHLYPGSVDLDELGEAPHRGVYGRDPKTEASAADGAKLTETIVSRLATLGARMPRWDAAAVRRFVEAESALVARQLTLAGESGNVWQGWRHIGAGACAAYGRLLAEEQFDQIAALAETL